MPGTRIAHSPAYRPAWRPACKSTDDSRHDSGYLLRDEFLTTEAAPLVSPRTAEPGPGTLTLVQTDGEFSIVGGKVNFPVPGDSAGRDQGFYHTEGIARVPGRMVLLKQTYDTLDGWAGLSLEKQARIWEYVTGGDVEGYFGMTPAGVINGEGGANIGSYAIDTEYDCAFVLRADGHFMFIKGGDYTEWTLLCTRTGETTTPLYANWTNHSSKSGTLDSFRIPSSVWRPTPLASDSFNRTNSSDLGSTDGAGAEEIGGDGKVWTKTQGTGGGYDLDKLEIKSNKLTSTDATAGENVFATVDVGASDILIEGAFVPNGYIEPTIRFQDSDNLWSLSVNATVNKFQIFERLGGTSTERAVASVTINAGTSYYILGVADDETITAYLDGTNRITYGSAAGLKTKTEHGAWLDDANGGTEPTIENLLIWPRTFSNFPNV